jgi:hypothetical protein
MQKLLLISLVVLSGCGPTWDAKRAEALRMKPIQEACAAQNPEPYPYSRAFGAVGAAVFSQTPEEQTWHQNMLACVEKNS